jgi:hypothetical protein
MIHRSPIAPRPVAAEPAVDELARSLEALQEQLADSAVPVYSVLQQQPFSSFYHS